MGRYGDLARVDIRPVLDYYGVQYNPDRPGWQTVKCVFHEDRNASARVLLEDGGAFFCNGCDARGNAITLLIQRGDADGRLSALEFLQTELGASDIQLPSKSRRESRRSLLRGKRDYERGSSLLGARMRRQDKAD